MQLAISGTSGEYFRSLTAELQVQATARIVEALAKVFVPVYVGASVSLLVSVCFTVRVMVSLVCLFSQLAVD